MVKYARSTIKFQCKQCTEQLVEHHWTYTAHLFRDCCYKNGTNIENPQDLNDTNVPTEESRIESQTHNTEEMPNELTEEQRTQNNDDEHETHLQDPTSREATIATTDEPQNEEWRALQRKINIVCNIYKKSLVDMTWQVRKVNSCIQPHAEIYSKSRKKLQSTMQSYHLELCK